MNTSTIKTIGADKITLDGLIRQLKEAKKEYGGARPVTVYVDDRYHESGPFKDDKRQIQVCATQEEDLVEEINNKQKELDKLRG